MPSNSLVDIISVVSHDPNIFLCIPASATDAAAVNPKRIKTLLANGLIRFFINGNPVFSNGPSNLLRSPPDWMIFDNWVFDSYLISADELFAKDLRILETCLSVNNNSWEKLVSLLPIMFGNNLNTTSDSFFITDFNLLSYDFDSFTLKLLYCVILYW